MDPVVLNARVQEFQGVRYHLHSSYFFHGGQGLHRAVWAATYGPIPAGWHIHHVNHQTHDNRLDNLTAVPSAAHLRATWADRKPVTRSCVRCGHPFECITHHKNNRFCSNSCKSAWRRAKGIDDVEQACAICGQTYRHNRYQPSQTCSRSCRAKMREQRKRSR